MKNTKTFQENLSILFDEFYLAKQWGKGSIILTIHKTKFSQEKTKKALEQKLGKLGYSFVEIEINKVEGNFIEYVLQHENIKSIVFFFSNIAWGGGEEERDGYRLLNLYRETFVEQEIKAVFFLTLREAANLPNYAPDFWAFRHRVLGFGTPHAHNQKPAPAGLMLWHEASSFTPAPDIKSKISSLRTLLSEMPEHVEAVSARIGLLYELGFLYWQLGDHHSAEKALTDALELAKAYDLFELMVKLQNGLAIISYEQENYNYAIELLEPMIENNPRDCLLLLNKAIALFAMKKNYRAITMGKKATSIFTQNSWVWNSLGYLYYFAGDMDNAISSFQKAIDVSPESGFFYESLAICFLAIGLKGQANVQLYQAQNTSDNRLLILEILEECIEGNKENAVRLITAAINAGEFTKLQVGRDPTLHALFDLNEINQI